MSPNAARLTALFHRVYGRFAARRRVPVPQNATRRKGRARLAVLLLPPCFAAVLLGAWAGAEAVVPEITDTDYHARLKLLRAARAENPDRPLGVMLGSSRTVWAFRPEQLPDADGVSWFNMSHVGSGPTLNRVILHRLLRDGVRPAVVVVEVMPSFFVKENDRFVSSHFALADVPVARRYANKPFGYDYHVLRHRLTRAADLARVGDPFAGYRVHHTRGGHTVAETELSADERARRTAAALKEHGPHLRHLTARPAATRALRDTLREAADHGARVVVLRSPEGPTFRSWYDADALARFDAHIADVARQCGADTIDARDWLAEEDFCDSHHTLTRGADTFTARLAREYAELPRR